VVDKHWWMMMVVVVSCEKDARVSKTSFFRLLRNVVVDGRRKA